MPIDLLRPDLAMSLALDPYAPRAARYHVSRVDRPSPDLRNTVVLLTSELVTRAVQHREPEEATMELRVWMPAEVVRVELRAAHRHLHLPSDNQAPDYRLMLLDELADRWSLDDARPDACMWFEIDRHTRPAPQARHARASPEPRHAGARREKSGASR
jgi:hypothetical protein